jgi:hypothetical protein
LSAAALHSLLVAGRVALQQIDHSEPQSLDDPSEFKLILSRENPSSIVTVASLCHP